MTRIPPDDRDVLEQAIYLPMLLTVLNRDLKVVEKSPFKLRNPYIDWIAQTIKEVQKDLANTRKYMRDRRMKAEKVRSDDLFTMYVFLYNGYEEYHNYFNPRLRNKVEELMKYYLFERYHNPSNSANPSNG
ncbi:MULTISPECIES: hypothetical protein [Bacillus]|jgi:hypothetical protein|uniref:hypothetical protein n=1 Tax=Bacillus TaxID=1386 RepID=UPI00065DEC68|nr:hypothetical protein [Bacillus smithii]AKP46332.1 YhjD [Bacillus smithii]MED4884811.1 hypothetical protein [Bacillus smithii]MED4927066.1 hypothetical protein [Bacillus smithii]